MRFLCVKIHIEFTFHYRDPYGSGVTCPWIFYYRTYACNTFLSPKAGPLVMASITPASSSYWNKSCYHKCCNLLFKNEIRILLLISTCTRCTLCFCLWFLAHLGWKLKWAFLIACCPAFVCLAVCLSVHFNIFDFFSENTAPILTN
jgi:hypothetical protein